MKRHLAIGVLVAAFLTASATAAPITKQNGKNGFKNFTSICAVAGFANYGLCNGDTTKFTGVVGRIDAVQPKPGVYNLNLMFTGLVPGLSYRLYGAQSGVEPVPGAVTGYFFIAKTLADANGIASFSYQTTNPADLGFDLNVASGPDDPGDYTVVTSWWTKQWLEVNPDSTLYVLAG